MFRFGAGMIHRDLVGAGRTGHQMAVHAFQAGPTLRRAQNDHRPLGLDHRRARAGLFLNASDRGISPVEQDAHATVECLRRFRVIERNLHEQRFVTIAGVKGVQLAVVHRPADGSAGDLVAVDMQDRQHRAVADRVEEFRRVPGGRGGSGLGLAIADDAGDNQIGIVEGRPEGGRQGIAQFTAFVDGAGRARGEVAGKPARPGECLDQFRQTVAIQGVRGVVVGECSLEVQMRQVGRRPVPGAGDQHHRRVGRADQAIQVGVDKPDARHGPPVSQQAGFDVLGLQRLLEQAIAAQIDLGHRQVVGGPPQGVHRADITRRPNGNRGSGLRHLFISMGGLAVGSVNCGSFSAIARKGLRTTPSRSQSVCVVAQVAPRMPNSPTSRTLPCKPASRTESRLWHCSSKFTSERPCSLCAL